MSDIVKYVRCARGIHHDAFAAPCARGIHHDADADPTGRTIGYQQNTLMRFFIFLARRAELLIKIKPLIFIFIFLNKISSDTADPGSYQNTKVCYKTCEVV
jgi:hypothetical protein